MVDVNPNAKTFVQVWYSDGDYGEYYSRLSVSDLLEHYSNWPIYLTDGEVDREIQLLGERRSA